MRARKKLGWRAIAGRAHAPNALQELSSSAISLLNTTQRLWLALGEFELFRASVSSKQIQKNRAAFYGLYQKLGDYHRPWRRAGKVAPKSRVANGQISHAATWRASYAVPHHSLVRQIAAETQIQPEMVYAIMRTESGFNQRAVSPVGALGLMQLMPYTAAFVAEKIKHPQPSREELLAPHASISLGTHFLDTLKQTFPHDFLVAAAYNGSPKAVTEWLATFGDLDTLMFVERIPYKETRQYVKKVMATKAIYRALDGHHLSLNFPEQTPKRQNEFPEIKTLDVQLN